MIKINLKSKILINKKIDYPLEKWEIIQQGLDSLDMKIESKVWVLFSFYSI